MATSKMSVMMTEFKLPREFRIHRQSDFNRVHQANVFAADDTLVIKAALNGQELTRVGISLSRQVGNAVIRNRWKRLVREAFRTSWMNLPVGLDLVVRPRRGAVADLRLVQQSLARLTLRLARRLAREQP
jgi:ribonuclease P protein component